MPVGISSSAYQWDNNTYFTDNSTSASPFSFEVEGKSASHTFPDWQRVTGFDRHSELIRSATSKPSGVKVFIRPNSYERGRANIVVYNWEGGSKAEVNLGNLLEIGKGYEIFNVYDFFGKPVVSGVYDGKAVQLPMMGTKTGPEFNAFVLISKEENTK